jgi:hypothetical protein
MPDEILLRIHGSPVPAHTMFTADGATARDPIEETGCPSKIGCQVVPASDVLKMPPEADPA